MRKSDLHRSLRDEWEGETFQRAIEMYDGDESGAVLVENLIGRIEAGVYS